jgi:hypothetical protein
VKRKILLLLLLLLCRLHIFLAVHIYNSGQYTQDAKRVDFIAAQGVKENLLSLGFEEFL